MKYSFLALVLFSIFSSSFAQISETSIDVNPVLIQKNKQDIFSEPKLFIQEKNTKKIFRNEIFNLTTYLISGENTRICTDTIDDNTNGNFECLGCSVTNFGTTSMDSTCLEYLAQDIEYGKDTIGFIIGKYDANGDIFKDSILYPIVIKRENQTEVKSTTELKAFESATFDFSSDIHLNTDHISTEIVNCDIFDFETEVTLLNNTSFVYKAGGYSESDIVCVVVCDEATVCDTIKYPFKISHDTLSSLPFFDDFSTTKDYPDSEKWLTNDVFINTTMSNNNVSLGMASFDGIDKKGRAHANSYGISDYLVSTYINLEGYFITNELSLSFYLQRKGLCDTPEYQDSLVLQFKNKDNEWIRVASWKGLTNEEISKNEIQKFSYNFVPINQDQFLHSGFQFRFFNYSGRTGAIDFWHLDYVILDQKTENAPNKDISLTRRPTSLLKYYKDMPWQQFKDNESEELANEYGVSLFNHHDQIAEITEDSISFQISKTSSPLLTVSPLIEHSTENNDRNVIPDTLIHHTYNNYFKTDFISALNTASINEDEPVIIETIYKIFPKNETNYSTANNIASSQTVFNNYFAYDDGSAESHIAAQGAGTMVATKFHLNKPSELSAIRIHIPNVYESVSKQFFKLKVWYNLNDAPIYESPKLKPKYITEYIDSLQGFTNYLLRNEDGNPISLDLNAGDFYVGWEQISNNFDDAIPVGFDKNFTKGKSLHLNKYKVPGEKWVDFPIFLQGALMLRPVLGDMPGFETQTRDKNSSKYVIYPNPSSGIIFIKDFASVTGGKFKLFNAQGKVINEGTINQSKINIGTQNGLYLLLIWNKNNNFIQEEKIILQK